MRARDPHGRFAKGDSGNPKGRPRGIPNPKRRIPDLIARPLRPEALLALLDKKPDLLRPLAEQLLPPRLAASDPAELIGLRLSALRTPEDVSRAMRRVWLAVARGELAPVEALRLARRVRTRMRAIRRRARQRRWLTRATSRLTAGAGPG